MDGWWARGVTMGATGAKVPSIDFLALFIFHHVFFVVPMCVMYSDLSYCEIGRGGEHPCRRQGWEVTKKRRVIKVNPLGLVNTCRPLIATMASDPPAEKVKCQPISFSFFSAKTSEAGRANPSTRCEAACPSKKI